eukprot:6507492-Prymnesium_polylepis.1
MLILFKAGIDWKVMCKKLNESSKTQTKRFLPHDVSPGIFCNTPAPNDADKVVVAVWLGKKKREDVTSDIEGDTLYNLPSDLKLLRTTVLG